MNITQAVGIVSLLTLISKLTGFVREMVIARGYGAGVATDAYRVAQGVPGLFFACVGAALATVLVPVFTQSLQEGGSEKAFAFTRKLASVVILILAILSVIGVVAAPVLVRMFAPGFRGEAYALSVQMTRVFFPGLIFTALAFLAAGTLQSVGQFTVPALMGLPLNFLVIILVLTLGRPFGVWTLVWATFAGTVAQFLIQWPALRRIGYRFHWDIDFKDPSIRQVGALITPVVLGTAVLQINTLIDRMFASNLPAGSISILDYCNKLTGLVVGIVITAVATVTLPGFSKIAASGRRDELALKTGQSLGALNALVVPMAVGLMVLRIPIVRFVYERGAFTPGATHLTSEALLFASFGLVGLGMREIAARAFYALKDSITPMINSVIAMLVNIAFLFLFVGHFKWGVAGMALATALSFTFAGLLLTTLLRRKMGGIGLRVIVDSAWRTALAAGIMGLVLWRTHPVIAVWIPGEGFLSQAVELCTTIGVSGLIYVGALTLLRTREAAYGWAKLSQIRNKFVRRPMAQEE